MEGVCATRKLTRTLGFSWNNFGKRTTALKQFMYVELWHCKSFYPNNSKEPIKLRGHIAGTQATKSESVNENLKASMGDVKKQEPLTVPFPNLIIKYCQKKKILLSTLGFLLSPLKHPLAQTLSTQIFSNLNPIFQLMWLTRYRTEWNDLVWASHFPFSEKTENADVYMCLCVGIFQDKLLF